MTPTKLSESDKLEILRLYRQSDENTITLSKRYGVSSSTVRRILQNALSEEEYEALVQQKQKRLSHSPSNLSPAISDPADGNDPIAPPADSVEVKASPSVPPKLTRRRSSAPSSEAATETAPPLKPQTHSELGSLSQAEALPRGESAYPDRQNNEFEEDLEEEELLEEEDFGDFDDEDDEDDDLDDFDGDDTEFDEGLERRLSLSIQLRTKTQVQVLPLSEASLPKTCYLVVDRAAELITRPLKAFGELGQIPDAEIREKTLPVFDNHRVARRFSTRNQRVFKVPDGRLLQKAAPYLQAKGITRLLIDGQVYSL